MTTESRKMVQLHKKDDTNDQWIPLTTGECVQLTDYENNGETGDIEQTDDLNTALAKLENDKAAWGETLSAYGIADAYTKDEVDAMFSGIYHVRGSIASANIHAKLSDSNTRAGDVYDLSDDTVLTADFIEYEGQPTPIAKGTNIVVVNTGTDENPVYKFDTLSISISSSIPEATSNALGGIKIGYTDNTVNTRNYAVQLDNQKAYVYVPWESLPPFTSEGKCLKIGKNGNNELVAVWDDDNDTQYESKQAANGGTDVSLVTTGEKYVWNGKQDALPSITGQSGKFLKVVNNGGTLGMSWENDNDVHVNTAAFLDDTTNNASTPVKMTLTMSDGTPVTANIPKVGASGAGVVPKGASVSTQSQTTKFLREDGTWATPSYTSAYVLPTAADGTLGGIQIGYTDNTANTRNYPVQLFNGKAFVNVPWTDTDPIPSQSGNNNKFLMTNGSTLSWATPSDLNTFRAIQVDNTQLLANDSNKALDIIGGKNISLTTGGNGQNDGYASVTINVSATDHYVTSGDLTVSNNACEFEVESGQNYFIGSTADVAHLAALTSLTVVVGSNSNGACESNIFFKADSTFALSFEDSQGNAVSVKVIGEEPTYSTGREYLMSYYKGTVIFGELTARQ